MKGLRTSMLLFFLLQTVLLMGFSTNLYAVPASDDPITLEQPDGAKFTAKIRGDEFQNWIEDGNGYTILQNSNTKFWEYAIESYEGELVSSGVAVNPDIKAPQFLIKGLKPQPNLDHQQMMNQMIQESYRERLLKNGSNEDISRPEAWTPVPVSGSRKVLIVLVNFSNRTLQTTASGWYDTIFSSSSKSMARFFSDNSFNTLTISPASHTQSGNPQGIVTVTINMAHPNLGRNYTFSSDQTWGNMALAQAASYVNFNSFDTDGDGKLSQSELSIYFITAGYEASGSTKTPNMWAHAWWATGTGLTAGSKNVQRWALNGELNDYSVQHPMGVITHELGHALCGLPDLYDTSGNNQGLGQFSLMAGGSWGADVGEYSGTTPVTLDGWSREYLGWAVPQQSPNGTVSLSPPLGSQNSLIKIVNTSVSSNEYFLAEYRYPTNWDLGLKGKTGFGSSWAGGLLITHIDRNIGTPGNNDINRYVSGSHQGVVAEQASTSSCDMLAVGSTCRGYGTTLFYSGNNSSWGPTTTPNSKYYNGTNSNFSISNISTPGSTISMTVSSGSSTCTYSISPTSAYFDASGGTWYVTVTPSSSTCTWTASSSASWITITSGSSGTGNGTVNYSVLANTTSSTRTGTITVGGQTHTITQAAGSSSCNIVGTWTKTYDWSCNGADGTVNMTLNSGGIFTTTEGYTGTWTLSGSQATITYSSGTTYTGTVDSSCNGMSGTMVSYTGATGCWTATRTTTTCTYTISPTSAYFDATGGTWYLTVTPSSSSCTWTATSNASWITISSGSSGTGNGTVNYYVSANTTTSQRTGTITVGGQTHTITQAAGSSSCNVSISPTTANYSSSSSTGSFNVTVVTSTSPASAVDELLASQYNFQRKDASGVEATASNNEKLIQYDSLKQKASSDGSVKIIIKLNEPFIPEGLLSGTNQVDEQRSAIAQRQDIVLSSLSEYRVEAVKRFEYIPFMALETDLSGLSAIYANPNVSGVYEDKLAMPMLSESVPLIQGNQAWTSGYTGSGQTVAILDTGVQSSHPFLSGKVVSEACYSTTYTTYNSTSVCPNGSNEQTGTGAGVNCSITGCDHGTHVAGISAGLGSSFSGVAKGANIIAVQVFTRFNSSTYCGSSVPCVLSYTSDQIKGLERVYALRSSYNISSINMSIGGGKSTTNCDSTEAATKAAIDNLRSAGIATVIASGNDSYTDGISSPGCISTAVSVGSTTKSDVVSSFSNSASFLNLLAPGSSIYSSVPTSSYNTMSGTSMATPHVTGAWAIMKQKKPTGTVTEILQAFQNTGKSITDSRNGIVKPRINLMDALNSIGGGGSCTWTAASNASWISNINPSSGTGSATVTYSVSANSGTSKRTGLISINSLTHTVAQTDTIFTDVDSSMWSKDYILALYNNGITYGCMQNPLVFCTNDYVTRGQMAAFIIRAKYGESFTYPTTPYFTDVPSTNTFFNYVQRLKQDNITTNVGTYWVNDYVTRGQMAAFIIRAKYGESFTYPTTPYFTDVPSTNTFFKYVQRLKQDNITTNVSVYLVDNIVTREQMAAFISRGFLGMP